MADRKVELTRRKVLASLGAVGAAGAGAGVGTSALFSDEESFQNNSLAAGELDLKVDWEEHYSYPQLYGSDDPTDGLRVTRSDPADDNYVGLPDPDDPVVWVHEGDLDEYMGNTVLERSGPTDDPPDGVVELNDVKPGDFGEVTYSYRLLDNPGYVTLGAEVIEDAENGVTEPEASADGEDDPEGQNSGDSTSGELGETIQAALWYDPDCDNVFDSGEDPIKRGTLNEVLAFLGADPPGSNTAPGDPLVLDPQASGGRISDDYGEGCHRVVGSDVDCSEVFYFTNVDDADDSDIFGTPGDDTTKLYEAKIQNADNDPAEEAQITDVLVDFENIDSSIEDDYDHIVSIAASADGRKVYVIGKFSNHLGVYDTQTDSFDDKGEISNAPDTSLQAAVSPDGELYFTVFGESTLYVIENPDASNPAVDRTIAMTDQNGDPINVGGSDIAFLADNTLYVIDGNTNDNTSDLYEFSNPSTGNGELVGELPSSVGLPGIAVRASGTGNLIGIDSNNDRFYELDPSDGSEVATYETVNSDGSSFSFAEAGGDMTVGPLCPKHCVALAWWIPREVGNKIQSDSYTFDVTFRAEQCRNNDRFLPTDAANHWPLDSVGDGTAEDVVNGSDGTVQSGISAANGRVGSGAASFSGTSNFVALPGSFNGDRVTTVSLWADTDPGTNPEFASVFASSDDPQIANTFQIDVSGSGEWRINGFGAARVIGPVSASGFDHIAVSIGNGRIRAYLNGVKTLDVAVSSATDARYENAAIGTNRHRNVPFDGVVDDVRVYDRVLDSLEVGALYNAQ